MCRFRKSVNNGQDGGVTIGGRKTSDEVHSDVRPGSLGDWKWMQKPGAGLIGSLITGTDGAGSNELTGVFLHSWPPEPLPFGKFQGGR